MMHSCGSTSAMYQSIVHEDLAAYGKPATKRNLDCFASTLARANPAGKLTAQRETSPLILHLTINKEPFSAEPPVFHANLMTTV